MSGSSHHAARIVKELGKSGEPVFSSGMQNCLLLVDGDARKDDDYYSIPKGPLCIESTGLDIYRSAFSEINTYFFNGHSFAEQLEEFYNLKGIKQKIDIDSTKSFATFKAEAHDNQKYLIALVRLFFETKLDPKLVDFLMNGLGQNGFLDRLVNPLYITFAAAGLIPGKKQGDASSQERKYEIFVGVEGKEVEIFQSYNINKMADMCNPEELVKKEVKFVKKEVKTVAHIKASVDANRTISASMEYHASASKEDRKYAAKTIQKVTPEDAVLQAVLAKDLITLNKLLQNSYLNLDVQDGKGKTALHYAAAANSPDMVLALVDAGANVLIKDKFGQAPYQRVQDKTSKCYEYLHNLTMTRQAIAMRGDGDDEKKTILKSLEQKLAPSKSEQKLAQKMEYRSTAFSTEVTNRNEDIKKSENPTLLTWFARFITDLFSSEKEEKVASKELMPQRGESHGSAYFSALKLPASTFFATKPQETQSEPRGALMMYMGG